MSGKPWLYIIIFLLVILIAAGTTFLVLNLYNSDNGEEEATYRAGNTYRLGEFTVNVAIQRTFRFVQTDIHLQLVDERRIEEEVDEKTIQIRDAVITILRESGEEEVQDPRALVLREKIKEAINSIMGRKVVLEVYFTDFVIQ